MKYFVCAVREIRQHIKCEIEADSEKEARKKAANSVYLFEDSNSEIVDEEETFFEIIETKLIK